MSALYALLTRMRIPGKLVCIPEDCRKETSGPPRFCSNIVYSVKNRTAEACHCLGVPRGGGHSAVEFTFLYASQQTFVTLGGGRSTSCSRTPPRRPHFCVHFAAVRWSVTPRWSAGRSVVVAAVSLLSTTDAIVCHWHFNPRVLMSGMPARYTAAKDIFMC